MRRREDHSSGGVVRLVLIIILLIPVGALLFTQARIFAQRDDERDQVIATLTKQLEALRAQLDASANGNLLAAGARHARTACEPCPTCPFAGPSAGDASPTGQPASGDEFVAKHNDFLSVSVGNCLVSQSDDGGSDTFVGVQDRTDRCWKEARRLLLLSTLNYIRSLAPSKTSFFDPQYIWRAFHLFPETYQCDRNHMMRLDVDKWLCGPLQYQSPDQECVIYSLGSAGEFDFEISMHNMTGGRCKIHTFDCSGNWSHPVTTFHPWCISGEDDPAENLKSLKTINKLLGVKHVTLLKLDIEGSEFPLFKSLANVSREDLPRQVMFELHHYYYSNVPLWPAPDDHWFYRFHDLILLLDRMGYRLASKELNNQCTQCAEFTLILDPDAY